MFEEADGMEMNARDSGALEASDPGAISTRDLPAVPAKVGGSAEPEERGEQGPTDKHSAAVDDSQSPDRITPSASLRHRAEIAASVSVLAQVALQQEDPVAALEEGMEALAEALAERDLAVQEQELAEQAALELKEVRQADFRGAYRHARLHRVGELVDLGYSLDHAVAITDANEADIRARASAAGGSLEEVIYRYALMHGYRPQGREPRARSRPDGAGDPHHARQGRRVSQPSPWEQLATMNDEEFAKATDGERWHRLHRRL